MIYLELHMKNEEPIRYEVKGSEALDQIPELNARCEMKKVLIEYHIRRMILYVVPTLKKKCQIIVIQTSKINEELD